jgi:ferric-dicitrate binding protein FerR (iron transport regulator)
VKQALSQAAGRLLREASATNGPAKAKDAIVPDVGYAAARASLIETAVRERDQRALRAKVGRVLLVPVAAAAMWLVVVGARSLVRDLSEESRGFHVGRDIRGEVGAYYSANAEAPLPIRFDDGSGVELMPGARARVTESQGQKQVLSLETGSAKFEVAHHPATQWEVKAGPYVVHVTGTAFALSWEGKSQELSLKMRQGSVIVTGPGLNEPRRVSGQEELRLSANPEQPDVSSPVASSAKENPVEGTAESRRSSSTSRDPGWTELLSRGDYDLILQAANRRGVNEVLASGSMGDLRALADAARFRGDSALSQRVLTTLRTRFPRTEAAASATFLLGRQADDSNDLRSALRYYDQYLAEGGKLTAEASGRRMLVLSRLGRREESRRAAEEYLRRFPSGPYAKKASTLAR